MGLFAVFLMLDVSVAQVSSGAERPQVVQLHPVSVAWPVLGWVSLCIGAGATSLSISSFSYSRRVL